MCVSICLEGPLRTHLSQVSPGSCFTRGSEEIDACLSRCHIKTWSLCQKTWFCYRVLLPTGSWFLNLLSGFFCGSFTHCLIIPIRKWKVFYSIVLFLLCFCSCHISFIPGLTVSGCLGPDPQLEFISHWSSASRSIRKGALSLLWTPILARSP